MSQFMWVVPVCPCFLTQSCFVFSIWLWRCPSWDDNLYGQSIYSSISSFPVETVDPQNKNPLDVGFLKPTLPGHIQVDVLTDRKNVPHMFTFLILSTYLPTYLWQVILLLKDELSERTLFNQKVKWLKVP